MAGARPKTLIKALTNRRTPSMKWSEESADLKHLQFQLETLRREKRELEETLSNKIKENQRLKAKVREVLCEKQDLEALLRRKNDLLKFKPRSKLSNFMVNMQEKLINRPSLESVKQTKIWDNEACFDTDLNLVIMHETLTKLPKVLVECVTKLETKPQFMKQNGLYRASGNHATIQKLRFKIDSNNYKFLAEQTDPNNITGIVKLFFRELKTPLLPLKFIKEVIPDEKNFIDKKQSLQTLDVIKVFTLLPAINKATLKYFMMHLARVADIKENEMNAKSLSIVCGACICYETMQRQHGGFTESLVVPNKCVEIMILEGREVFA